MMRGTRVRGGRLEAAVRGLEHRNGRRVVLVGAVGIGQPSYFQQLMAVIAQQRQGAVVCCEGIHTRPADALREPGLTQREHDVLTLLDEVHELRRRRVQDLGWVSRCDHLHHPDWQVHDLELLQLVRMVGVGPMRTAAIRRRNALGWEDGDAQAAAAWRHDIERYLRASASPWPHVQRRLATYEHPIIDTYRRSTALVYLLNSPEDVVMVWEADHQPAMARYLLTQGFHRAWNRWVTVGRLPLVPVRPDTDRVRDVAVAELP